MKLDQSSELDAAGLKDLVVAAVEDRKGVDVVVLDVAAVTDVTDHMIIVGGTSNRHVKSIVDHVLETAKSHGVIVLGTEGREQSDWVLLDIADVVVHVMRADARAFYDLERLWEGTTDSNAELAAEPASGTGP